MPLALSAQRVGNVRAELLSDQHKHAEDLLVHVLHVGADDACCCAWLSSACVAESVSNPNFCCASHNPCQVTELRTLDVRAGCGLGIGGPPEAGAFLG
jgi:hypothetical protein